MDNRTLENKIIELEKENNRLTTLVEDLNYDLKKLLESYDTKEDYYSELEDEVNELRFEINTLDDDYKYNFFKQYKDKYTPWELEELLINGKLK